VGASTGLAAALLLAVSFIIGVSPEPPALDASAASWASFVDSQLDALRVETFLNSLAIVLFLWFAGSVCAAQRRAEGGEGRLAATALVGAAVGGGALLTAQVFVATATVHPVLIADDLLRLLFDVGALMLGVGGAGLSVFFAAVAFGSLRFGGVPKAVGALSGLVALIAALGFVTVFTDDGVFAADGAFGYWVRYAAFVVWLAAASVSLIAASGAAASGGRRR
jgi:hypothetical protein